MWTSGVTQGLMWRATTADGAFQYPNFVETLNAIRLMYWLRLIGGTAFLIGMIVRGWNLTRTALAGTAGDGTAQVAVIRNEPETPWTEIVLGSPVRLVVAVLALSALFALTNVYASVLFASLALVVALFRTIAVTAAGGPSKAWHRILEGRALLFSVLTVIAVLIGGVAEIVPSLLVTPSPATLADAKPYRALELEGRDTYVREGCYNCHSQMIRPFVWEEQRYGEPSTLADSQFDHPFQWGSKRTGPDLAREGGKYPHLWHYRHLLDPRSVSPNSNMPDYAALARSRIDFTEIEPKMRAMKSIGVPYSPKDLSALLMGFVGSTHCIAMCGGVVTVLSGGLVQLGRKPSDVEAHATIALALNAGRILSYSLAGAMVGGFGALLAKIPALHSAELGLRLCAGLLMLGLYLAGGWARFASIERLGLPLWRGVEPVARRFLPARSLRGAFVLGGLWGFMPCGLVYTALALSLGNTSAFGGAMTMGAFGLGTLPTLLTLGVFASRFVGVGVTRVTWVRRLAGAVVIGFGLFHASSALAAMLAPAGAGNTCGAHATREPR